MIIASRFNGPAGSGNGGYSAGLLAAALAPPAGQVAEVTLRRPPPLDTPLRVTRTADRVTAHHGERLVAEAVPVALTDPAVPPVSVAAAVAASERYPGWTGHPFPTCYVCGPDRAEGDGLRIFPGLLPDGRTAAVWRVPAEVTPLTVWAALDCPGGWAIIGRSPSAPTTPATPTELGTPTEPTPTGGTGDTTPAVADRRAEGAGRGVRPYVLGRIAAQVHSVPAAGAECVVVGAVLGVDGRKALVGSAVYQPMPDGGAARLAQARATWLAI